MGCHFNPQYKMKPHSLHCYGFNKLRLQASPCCVLEEWRLKMLRKTENDRQKGREYCYTAKALQNTGHEQVHVFTSGRGSWWITFGLEELAECCAGGGVGWGRGGGGGVQAPFLWDCPTTSWQARPGQIQADRNEEQKSNKQVRRMTRRERKQNQEG